MVTDFNKTRIALICGLAVLLAVWLAGCDPSGKGADLGVTAKASAAETKPETKPAKKPDKKQEEKAVPSVSKIVFVGKQDACQCKRTAIEASWSALQKALGQPARLPVERLRIDVDQEKVAVFEKQKAIMALPAIYFIDDRNTVIELLHGEVTEAQIRALLAR
jgi:hypothetical protein